MNMLEKQKTYIAERICYLRNERVILDIDLAVLYKVETRVLKQAVRRNRERFPEDFMFELPDNEIDMVVSQNVIPSKKYFGGARPFAFTEQGVAMLSGVLKSKQAIEVNIEIIRAFIQMRRMIQSHNELRKKLASLENKYDKRFSVVFEALKQLLVEKAKPRKQIGFKTRKDDNKNESANHGDS
jgi:hypothetical protein